MARLIRTQAALDAVREQLLGEPSLALDTEFHVERSYRPRLYLVQLCAPAVGAILLDVLAPIDLHALAPVFERVPVVVHGGQQDVELLARAVGVAPRVCFDTQVAAGCVGHGYPTRLQDLVRRFLGRAMDKGQTLSDWSARPLTEAQVTYAAEDVVVLHGLEAALETALASRRSRAAFERLQAEVYEDSGGAPSDDRAWLRLANLNDPDEAERSALRALGAWRERTARARDVPRYAVLGDALLADLARRRPPSVDALRANRRLPSSLWKRDGDDIVAVLRAASAGPPPPAPLRAQRPKLDLLRAALRVREAETGVAPELLLPEALLEGPALPDDLPGWRRELLGERFFAFLRGEGTLAVPKALAF